MIKTVQIAGTYREYAWRPQKRNNPNSSVGTKVLSKADADRIFSQKDFSRFSAEVTTNSEVSHG